MGLDRQKEFNRPARFFMWMLLHDGYTVGRHWKHISGCEDRKNAKCVAQRKVWTTYSWGCDAPGQREIWGLAQQIWRQKTKTDLTIMKGIIMSCGVRPPSSHRSQTKQGTERFHQILISESTHLIWKMRNDRVINDKPHHTTRGIEQRWIHALNHRMKLDCILSNRKRFQRKATQKEYIREQ